MGLRVTGLVEVLVNGEPLLNKAGAVASGIGVSGQAPVERKEVLGDGGLHGFTEEPVVAKLEVTLTDREDVSLSELASIVQSATIIFRSRGGSGKAYILNSATCVSNFSVTAGEGETPVAFFGNSWTETTQ